MDHVHAKPRMNAEGEDRLSILPDDLIYKILSSTGIKSVVQTSALSSRWRFLWTSMPYLNISSHRLPTSSLQISSHRLSGFVDHLLSGRNSQIDVYSLKLIFDRMYTVALLKQLLDYAFSHNVQQLTLIWKFISVMYFPIDLLPSPSIKYLRLTGCCLSPESTLELPALTTLHLDHVSFREATVVGLLSKCTNLKNLTLNNYKVMESRSFTLYHPRLSNLTLEEGICSLEVVNVVAPQLKSLTIRCCIQKHVITTPNISSLRVNDSYYYNGGILEFSTDLLSLEKVDLYILDHRWSGCKVFTLLQHIRNVKFLMLNLEFVEPLISYIEEISPQASPFSNLKSLKFYELYRKVNLTSKVKNYFLDGSPSATFTLISYEEAKEKQKARAIAKEKETNKEPQGKWHG